MAAINWLSPSIRVDHILELKLQWCSEHMGRTLQPTLDRIWKCDFPVLAALTISRLHILKHMSFVGFLDRHHAIISFRIQCLEMPREGWDAVASWYGRNVHRVSTFFIEKYGELSSNG